MKSTKTFNNISEKLLADIPKLKKGETVVFQMLNGVPNPDPDDKEKNKYPVLYGKVQVQTNFRIQDPYTNNGVDVGCVDIWDGDKPAKFRLLVPGMGEYSRFHGKFALTGGNLKDEELYEILWLSPEREGSPCSDSSVECLFKIMDVKADSKASVTKVSILRKALELAENIPVKKAREVMAALNQPNYQDEEVLLAKIGELARTTPDTFIQTYESAETPVRATIKEALDSNTISHDMATGEVKFGGVVLVTIKTTSSEAFINDFAKWINSTENGKDILNNIKGSNVKKTNAVTS